MQNYGKLLATFRKNYLQKTKENKQIIITIVVISVLFFITGNIFAHTRVNTNQARYELIKVVDFIKNTEQDLPIYYLWNDKINPNYNKWDIHNKSDRVIADCYQFLLKDKQLILVNREELEIIGGSHFVLCTQDKYLIYLMNDYNICLENQYGYLLISK